MIFKQIDEILSGRKTQTRWVCKHFDELHYADKHGNHGVSRFRWGGGRRTIWAVGRTYAVVPALGQPGVWWAENWADGTTTPDGTYSWLPVHKENHSQFAKMGYEPLRIRITAIWRERLQDISEADARAEGVESVKAYRALWDSTHDKKQGKNWKSNPDVWVLSFEVVREAA